MDVIEIDGASNRGIDEIRSLREAVKFSPSRSRYKIYIIDEVHMLTAPAFNALLKTLEEPPQHVKFIFATTEPHNLPATILSRCQRFDFRRIPVKDIALKLKEIAQTEKLDIEEGVFLYIAKASDGSMRDAESILDQLSSFSKKKVLLKDVINSLGMIEQEMLFRASDIVISRNGKEAISIIGEIFDSGKDAKQFLLELLDHFRNIMIIKAGSFSEESIDLPKDVIEKIQLQATGLSQGDIFYIINIILNSIRMMKQHLPERIILELCMIKLASRDSIVSIEEMLSKLPDIEKMPIHKYDIPKDTSPKEVFKPQPQVAKQTVPQNLDNNTKDTGKQNAQSVEIRKVKDAWPILIKAMAVKKMSISTYLAEGEPESVNGNTIFIAFPRALNFHREVLEEKNNKDSIETALSQILDIEIKLKFIAVDKEVEEKVQPQDVPSKEELRKKEPIIDVALNIFEGKILRVAKDT